MTRIMAAATVIVAMMHYWMMVHSQRIGEDWTFHAFAATWWLVVFIYLDWKGDRK